MTQAPAETVEPPDLATALLYWIRAFPTSAPVARLQDVHDGRILWEILRDIDPQYFDGDLPESVGETEDYWIPRWQNRESR